jgi:hypothetical protein
MEDRTDETLNECSWCGQKLIDGQRVFKPEVIGKGKPPVCCSIECAFRAMGVNESSIRQIEKKADR